MRTRTKIKEQIQSMQTGETDKTTAGTLKTKRELGTHKTIKSEHNKEPDPTLRKQ